MEYLFIPPILIFLIILKKFLFAKNGSTFENTYDKETIQEKCVEVFYELNISPIKLSFYDQCIFTNFYISNTYRNIIVKNLWIGEPFHTSFSKILYFIDNNNFWIKSRRTKEILINIRGINDENETSVSFKILATKELAGQSALDIFENMNGLINKIDLQYILLNSLIFSIIKSNDIQHFLKRELAKKEDEDELFELLINILFEYSSNSFKSNLLKFWESNYDLISETYFQNKKYAKEYPYTNSERKNNDSILLRLGNMPRKQLFSIK